MTVAELCKAAGMSRQNFYKTRTSRKRKQVDEQFVRHLVEAERAVQPRLGGLKLHKMLRERLEDEDVRLGRDRFFEVLRNQSLLLEPLPKAPRTTHSAHSLPVFANQIKDLTLTGPHQVWVSDITYIRTREDFLYLSLITDKYSRKVVGYHVGRTLETQDTLKALAMAIDQLPEGTHPIHHSDRGCQYCSHEYVKELQKHGMPVSMTEEDHCAENALAERVNGILKQEYFLNYRFQSVVQLCTAVDEAVRLYNTRRPHRSLKLCTPEEIHRKAA
ncbi:MAG: IS3 family transposase [Gammaproteobacteria bacterium]|nr:IS3 family transposase [Kiritimatiellia bacterium]MCP5426416.1 IS3 family transposase [Gammaproteobacteria bacterium]